MIYESKHNEEDEVDIDFSNSHYLKRCRVLSIRFQDQKEYYDIAVPVGFGSNETILYNVEGQFVKSPVEELV